MQERRQPVRVGAAIVGTKCAHQRDMDARTAYVTSPVSILVIEHASYSLPWLEREGSGQVSTPAGQVSSDIVVVSQLASEPPAAFATRVLRRLARLGAETPVIRAVLSC